MMYVCLAAVQISAACALRLGSHMSKSSSVEQLERTLFNHLDFSGTALGSPNRSWDRTLGPLSGECDDLGMFVHGVAAYRVPHVSPIPAPLLERHLLKKQDAKK